MRLNTPIAPFLLCLTAAVPLAGCGVGLSEFNPLRPAPTTPVRAETLPPPETTLTDPAADAATTETQTAEQNVTDAAAATTPQTTTEVAAFAPAEVDKMSGGWTVSDGSGSCSLFMSTTAWTGGYRAVTRGCPSTNLQSVNAWNVVDGKIALKNAEGSEIARLTRTGEAKFDGSFASGGAVSFSR